MFLASQLSAANPSVHRRLVDVVVASSVGAVGRSRAAVRESRVIQTRNHPWQMTPLTVDRSSHVGVDSSMLPGVDTTRPDPYCPVDRPNLAFSCPIGSGLSVVSSLCYPPLYCSLDVRSSPGPE